MLDDVLLNAAAASTARCPTARTLAFAAIRSEHPQNENKRVIGVVLDIHVFAHGAQTIKYSKVVHHDVLQSCRPDVTTLAGRYDVFGIIPFFYATKEVAYP